MDRRLIASTVVGTALSLSVFVGSAHATLFSFASDVNSNSFTFGGTAGTAGNFTLSDFSRPNTFNLLVDDNNGTAPTQSIAVEFRAALTLGNGASFGLGGTLFQHTYRVLGTFGFYDTMGNALLTVNIGPSAALFTVPGTQSTWATSGAVLGADSFADITYTASSAFVTALGGSVNAARYGVVVGASGTSASVGPDDFAFSLSVINSGSIGATVAIDPITKAPTSAWRSESSFSGSAFPGIPAPGAVALAAIGFGVIARRRAR